MPERPIIKISQIAFTPTPRYFIDLMFSGEKYSVVKVVALVIRKTLGWCIQGNAKHRRTRDEISRSQFMSVMGMSKNSARTAIDTALERGYITLVSEHDEETGTGATYTLPIVDDGEPGVVDGVFTGHVDFDFAEIPNWFFDVVLPNENESTAKIVLAMLLERWKARSTTTDPETGHKPWIMLNIPMSHTMLMERTGMDRKRVSVAVSEAERKGYIVCLVQGHAETTSLYQIRMHDPRKDPPMPHPGGPGAKLTRGVGKIDPGSDETDEDGARAFLTRGVGNFDPGSGDGVLADLTQGGVGKIDPTKDLTSLSGISNTSIDLQDSKKPVAEAGSSSTGLVLQDSQKKNIDGAKAPSKKGVRKNVRNQASATESSTPSQDDSSTSDDSAVATRSRRPAKGSDSTRRSRSTAKPPDPYHADVQRLLDRLNDLAGKSYVFTKAHYQKWYKSLREILQEGVYSAEQLDRALCSFHDGGYPLYEMYIFRSVVNEAVRNMLKPFNGAAYEQRRARPAPTNPVVEAERAGIPTHTKRQALDDLIDAAQDGGDDAEIFDIFS
jgi:hypothetical protein